MQLTFEDIENGKAEKELREQFSQAGEDDVESFADPRTKRTSGVSYRDIQLTFADGQVVILSIKQTGDIFAVKLNGKPLPIRAQDSEQEAIAEICKAMDSGRSRFQAQQARVKVTLPPSVRTPIPKIEQVLHQKHAEIDGKIHEAQLKVADLKNELAALPMLDAVGEPDQQDSHDPDPNFFSPDTGDVKPAGVTIERSEALGDVYEPRRGDNGAPVPEKTETTEGEDENEALEDQSQQYELSKHDPVNSEADRAIAANEQQADESKKPFNGVNVEQGDNEDPNSRLDVMMYY
jgi:hypothetical protein